MTELLRPCAHCGCSDPVAAVELTRTKGAVESVTCEACGALITSPIGRATRIWNLRVTDQLIRDLAAAIEQTVNMLTQAGVDVTQEKALLGRASKELGKEVL